MQTLNLVPQYQSSSIQMLRDSQKRDLICREDKLHLDFPQKTLHRKLQGASLVLNQSVVLFAAASLGL